MTTLQDIKKDKEMIKAYQEFHKVLEVLMLTRNRKDLEEAFLNLPRRYQDEFQARLTKLDEEFNIRNLNGK